VIRPNGKNHTKNNLEGGNNPPVGEKRKKKNQKGVFYNRVGQNSYLGYRKKKETTLFGLAGPKGWGGIRKTGEKKKDKTTPDTKGCWPWREFP